ncbi:hypothetical protein ACBO_26530 [Acinetobacter bouvetii]|nr:hypothetical protein ACBO_26530 [Acinetobacter bouvetii]
MKSTDSQGLKLLSKGEWKHKKPQSEYRRQGQKLHLGIDAKTLKIRAVQFNTNNVNDLLAQIPKDEQVDSIYTGWCLRCKTMSSSHLRSTNACNPSNSKNSKPWKAKRIRSLERNELLRTVKTFR